MSKSFLFGVGMGFVFFAVVVVVASRVDQRDVKEAKRNADLQQYQAELGDATPVQVGGEMKTERELVHSTLFPYADRTKVKISQVVATQVSSSETNSKILGLDLYVGLEEVLTKRVSPEYYFGKLAQESDAVVRGQALEKVSHITKDDAFVFTDYDVLVTEVLKNNALSPVTAGAKIIVTRPGGKVVVDGVIVKAADHYFSLLPIGNHDLVLFLRFVPATGAYQSTSDSGSFELEGDLLRPLTGGQYPPGVIRSGPAFLRTARAVSKF